MLRNDNITSQVNGTRDTFTTAFDFEPATLSLGYNGQLFPAGSNIKAILGTKTFQLDFAPAADTSFLSVIYEDKSDGGSIESIKGSSHPPRAT